MKIRFVNVAVIGLSVILLAGCGDDECTEPEGPEPEPVLMVSADNLDFGDHLTEMTFTISNAGSGTLDWTVAVDTSWLAASSESGSTAAETDTISVTMDRTGLDAGDYSGTVTVTPNVGERCEIGVAMTVMTLLAPEMVPVPAGTFTMGDGVAQCGVDERAVTLTRGFHLGQHEVTNQAYLEALQWAYHRGHVTATTSLVRDALDGSTEVLLELSDPDCEIQFDCVGTFSLRETDNAQSVYPAGYDPAVHPVKEVTWFGAVRYCDWLSMWMGLPRAYAHNGDWQCNGGDPYGASGYRLPTDAEWEYAAQFNDERIYPWGDEPPDCSRANFRDASFCVGWTSPIGSYPTAPTILELHDMAGNVWEWCNDWGECNLGTLPQTDPVGLQNGMSRALHGGSFGTQAEALACARHRLEAPDLSGDRVGFRLARTDITP
ncbi:SUMF1/EgtB/PvdO family nonheme iron enzyme [Candidatus Eisenbacteria bacterium]|uniref:SUMF1/EgtB/PvdO family nonheme iron enzyme n=1 Tax=Eiseniibacteriota bacterium TaxID=2212470 RepID=A0ABV6YL57_UNCEI